MRYVGRIRDDCENGRTSSLYDFKLLFEGDDNYKGGEMPNADGAANLGVVSNSTTVVGIEETTRRRNTQTNLIKVRKLLVVPSVE